MMRIAAIDVGSNSIHMIVAEARPDGHFIVLDRAKEMVRLGEKSLTTGRLQKAAMDRGIRTLATFKSIAVRHGVTRIRAVATSAVREAENGGEFIQRIFDEIGLRVRVIPGREEARLIHLGVAQVEDLERAAIAHRGHRRRQRGDRPRREGPAARAAQPEAGRRAHHGDASSTHDPPRAKEVARLEKYLRRGARAGAGDGRHGGRSSSVIGTSGTMLEPDLDGRPPLGRPPGHAGPRAGGSGRGGLTAQAARSCAPIARRASRCAGWTPKRVDMITAGRSWPTSCCGSVKATRIQACTWALREGLLQDFIAQPREGDRGVGPHRRRPPPQRRPR